MLERLDEFDAPLGREFLEQGALDVDDEQCSCHVGRLCVFDPGSLRMMSLAGRPRRRRMKIKDVAFVAYPSDDVAGTRAWYENTLGLAFAGPYIEDGMEKYNEAHLATSCFSLMASEWVGRPPGAGAGAVFEVDDLDAAIRELRNKGVTIDDVFEGPVCKQASFNDPERNKITLHERRQARA
jgi:catechol 2,3-dioxygenase-like lactoylglutathione lyase family enzyme